MMPIPSFLHSKWSLPYHKFGKKILFSKSPRRSGSWRGALSGCQLRSNGISSKSSVLHKKSNLRPPHHNAFNHVIKGFEESGGLTGRNQTEEDQHIAVTPVNIKHVGDYFTADLSSICAASHHLNLSYSLKHYKITCLMFKRLTAMCRSSLAWLLPVTPCFFKVLDEAVEGISMRGFKLLSL